MPRQEQNRSGLLPRLFPYHDRKKLGAYQVKVKLTAAENLQIIRPFALSCCRQYTTKEFLYGLGGIIV
jgi:hypothetical protein